MQPALSGFVKYFWKRLRSFAKFIIPLGLYGLILRNRPLNNREMSVVAPNPLEPELYNVDGKPIRTFYLKDAISLHNPYCFVAGRFPKYINWDRNNFGLDNHFYTHQNILETIGKPTRKFALLIESESIVPNDYTIFDRHEGLESEFEKIFTHSEKLLNKYKNATFSPGGGVWYGTRMSGGELNSQQYLSKSKNISIVSSNKQYCDFHKYRLAIASKCKSLRTVDTFGTFDGGAAVPISASIEKYRYSIAIENAIEPYYFTEKILNCFAAMTIPIYCGATKISEYFNMDGIIILPPNYLDKIEKVISECTAEAYVSRSSAIIENYYRVQKYLCIEDYIYNENQEIFGERRSVAENSHIFRV